MEKKSGMNTETKNQTIEEKIFDAYKIYPSFVQMLTENGKLLLSQITNGTKFLNTLSDRDKGRWKSVLKSFEKWGGEQMYDLSQAEKENETQEWIDDTLNSETDFKSQSNESEPETAANESDESIASSVELDEDEPFYEMDDDYRYQDTRQPDEDLTDADYEAIQKEFGFDLPDEPTGLIKREDDAEAIQGEVELPMTEEDIFFRESLEAEFLACETYVKNARYKQGEIVREIIERRLYRNTHKTFGEYAVEVLNLTREYAIQIANISHYPRLLEEAIDASESVTFSINAGIAMDKSMRRLAEETGLEHEFEMMRPFIVDSFRALVDIAPKDKQGNPVLSPPLVTKYGEVMREVVQSGTVTIDGEQMTIHEAKEKGLLQHGLQMEVLTATEETIRAKQDYISTQAIERYERKTTPVIPNKRSTAKDVWIGQVPQFTGDCTEHGETKIISIGNGTFQTACKCRWQIDNDTKTLVCFECEGKRI